jgi:hypothetical protein
MSLADSDGDGLLDILDPCPNQVDCDGDQFSDYAEIHVGTDPIDACPDDANDDAWPPDTKIDGEVNILDVVKFKPVILHCSGEPAYNQRYDLVVDGCINVLDVVKLKPYIYTRCTNP